MPKRSSKRPPTDINQLAVSIVAQATSQTPPEDSTSRKKNPNAVELGRLGGLKGGKARAEKLSPQKRSNIAKRAAFTRWKKVKDKNRNQP